MRTYLIVIDSFGAGADSRAAEFGDEGANTMLHASQAVPGRKWRFLGQMGLGNAALLAGFQPEGCPAVERPLASYGILQKKGPGKDTLTGHWEIAGLVTDMSMRTFPPEYPSFPAALMERLEKAARRPVLGNRAASGTVIIQELGAQAYDQKAVIAYTSADSVLQLAAHEEAVPLEELYRICEEARLICDDYQVGRVIARPFIGNARDGYVRTAGRHDYSIEKPGPSNLEGKLHDGGWRVVGVGKIHDIFNGEGIDVSYPDKGNTACFARVLELAGQARHTSSARELIFVNLVDTDMEYGHRRDPEGYCREVERISSFLEQLWDLCDPGDKLFVTADHGCDPTFKGTDHTREYVPLLAAKKGGRVPGDSLGVMDSFAACMAYI